ncbi:hypothetical protein [Streptomyces sp. NPDC091371]|uniref:hypothetical protein n=1 Tax=Streptomyces sp. NPDC091371 TaxID=3155303 RepID=UPI00342D2ECC
MADFHDIWRRAEAVQLIDALAGFLVSRYPDSPGVRREIDGIADAGRAAAAAGRPGEAARQYSLLHERAQEWAGHPHHVWEPRPAEADALVRDYVKDLLRGRLSRDELDRLSRIRGSVSVISRQLLARADVDAPAREDVRYLVARAETALDLGHVPAARRELDRLRGIEERYRDPEPG